MPVEDDREIVREPLLNPRTPAESHEATQNDRDREEGDHVSSEIPNATSSHAPDTTPAVEQETPPVSILLINPDGTYVVASDPNAPKPSHPPLEPEEQRDYPLHPLPHPMPGYPFYHNTTAEVVDRDDITYVTVEDLMFIRKKRSFLFLLMMELSYFLLLFFVQATLEPVANVSTLLIFVLSIIVDIMGVIGAYRNQVHCLTFFIVFEGLSIGIGAMGDTEHMLMIVCRLLVLVLGMQLREGMLRMRSQHETNRWETGV
mmetsp:Transcript_38359/g.62171  ORF Transcript_38359/g.62171 Transcript_38359/m.62171 type:complete len:259 (-) Transcript_38359:436-1212(-)|eukprot:CAMPEP_0184657932 /NCGR_PEP_ID=MMETSP0308-20130426/22757_1 /TAXON_ID=38269 /ORGANISM="Gloeochaete witrockiana, Strain SAG 46.84" /LENGTH=258 /DNA_ID=CAMNT_0027096397 /DNA_START=49 /DNA_END=825 /DNA_ORIENTATION=-